MNETVQPTRSSKRKVWEMAVSTLDYSLGQKNRPNAMEAKLKQVAKVNQLRSKKIEQEGKPGSGQGFRYKMIQCTASITQHKSYTQTLPNLDSKKLAMSQQVITCASVHESVPKYQDVPAKPVVCSAHHYATVAEGRTRNAHYLRMYNTLTKTVILNCNVTFQCICATFLVFLYFKFRTLDITF